MNNEPGASPVPPASIAPQPAVNIVKADSRLSFAAHIALGALWALVYFLANAVQEVLKNSFGRPSDMGLSIVVFVSVAIPLLPIFLFANRRLQRMLASNPANIEDLNFKKKIRKSLFLITLIGVVYVSYRTYQVLNILFLDSNGDLTASGIALVVNGAGLGFLAWYSWSFYNKMRA
ncbi:hypothetical protein C4552_00550 [Candidatus Parcubacteria bacterium]|nr:MAG: hypothetical protein C4552_00550 [Candidatus Parcubacteria bacterium]